MINKDFENFVNFLREEIGEFNLEITETTTLEDDLGVTGDEAYDLIKRFSVKYNVDISDFKASSYFYPEPSFLSKIVPIKPLTIGDLFYSIKEKKLI